MSSVETIQRKMQTEISKFNEIQKRYQKLLKDRELSDGQLNENKSVYEELKILQEGSKVYKLIGPALVEQQLPEALKNVNERINFIETKMKSVESNIKELEKEQEKQREILTKLNQSLKPEVSKP